MLLFMTTEESWNTSKYVNLIKISGKVYLFSIKRLKFLNDIDITIVYVLL